MSHQEPRSFQSTEWGKAKEGGSVSLRVTPHSLTRSRSSSWHSSPPSDWTLPVIDGTKIDGHYVKSIMSITCDKRGRRAALARSQSIQVISTGIHISAKERRAHVAGNILNRRRDSRFKCITKTRPNWSNAYLNGVRNSQCPRWPDRTSLFSAI